VVYVALETLKALEYAHTKTNETGSALGIVHRDVSPSNVIVSARGEVKLFDFGIVKAEGRVTKTQSGVVKGNVTFMSPEQARGSDVDGRADLFSLGLVIFYCLTGQVLYAGNTTYELLVKAATGPGPDELNQLRALPEPWADLLQRALQVRPDDRFQTAREFAEAVASRVGGGAAALAGMMKRLFAEDFRDEEARFRTVDPTAPGVGLPSGETAPRRS
jgi:serine/threonine protein kinase